MKLFHCYSKKKSSGTPVVLGIGTPVVLGHVTILLQNPFQGTPVVLRNRILPGTPVVPILYIYHIPQACLDRH